MLKGDGAARALLESSTSVSFTSAGRPGDISDTCDTVPGVARGDHAGGATEAYTAQVVLCCLPLCVHSLWVLGPRVNVQRLV